LKEYSRALELEPKNYSAALFIGNTYDKQKQWAQGAEWYERAIRIDPNVETAYRYYADMLAKQGDMAKARLMLIHAAAAEPYNRMVWRELRAWATLNHTRISEVFIGIPAPPVNSPAANSPAQQLSPVWQAYYAAKASWQNGGEFRKHFPEEKEYRHSLGEESAALNAAADVLERQLRDKEQSSGQTSTPDFDLLLRLRKSDLIAPYVLFSLGDSGIARDYDAYRTAHREKLEQYLETFVVPRLP
jgi:tetratricopeptide (TPR) repeat protein